MEVAEQDEFFPDTVEECQEEMEDLRSINDEIAAQISLHDDGLMSSSDPTWRARALKAMIHNKKSISELRRHVYFLNGGSAAGKTDSPTYGELKTKINHIEGKLKSVEKQLEEARMSNAILKDKLKEGGKEKISRVQMAVNRQNYANTKLKQYIAETAPELLPGAHACLTLAQAEFDAASQK